MLCLSVCLHTCVENASNGSNREQQGKNDGCKRKRERLSGPIREIDGKNGQNSALSYHSLKVPHLIFVQSQQYCGLLTAVDLNDSTKMRLR